MSDEPEERFFYVEPDPHRNPLTMAELADEVEKSINTISETRLDLRDPEVEWLLSAYTIDLTALALIASQMLADMEDGDDITFDEYVMTFKSCIATVLLRVFREGRGDSKLNGWRDQL